MTNLLVLISVVTGTLSFVALFRPFPKLWMPTRKRALVIWLASFILLAIAAPEPETSEPAEILETNVVAEQSAQPPAPAPESESSDPQTEDRSDAEALTVIASPGFGEYDTMRRRFEFLVAEFTEYCPVEEGEASPADMLVVSHEELKKAGLDGEESLLDLANTLHRMTAEISASAGASGLDPPRCSEIWVMYLTLRLQGQPSTEAREGVTGVVGTLYGLTDG